MASLFTQKVIELTRSIPAGKVATYGGIAALAGNRCAARQVARILHSCSERNQLPWHRVVNREGKISLDPMQGGDRQKELLTMEGVGFDARGVIDLEGFLWHP